MYLGISHYLYFFLTLLGLLLVTRYCPGIVQRTEATAELLSRRAFHSTLGELPKFALIRIALGVILTWRAYDILTLLTPSDYMHGIIMLAAWANVLTGILLILGLLTQWSFAYLLLVQWQQADWWLGTSTLGNDVAAILVLMLMLVNAGRYHSLDSLLARVIPRLRPWLLYYASATSAAAINNAKLIALFSYWLVCLYSLSMHLNEPAWMTGVAGPQLLSSNFMSTLYAPLIKVFEQSEVAVQLARIVLWMMLPWYLLLFPAVLAGGRLRQYAIAWGVLFFIVSKFVLQLGWLSEIELLLWLGLFWCGSGIAHGRRFAVAFDDTCNLCDRTVQFVRFVDIFDCVELRPASANKEWLKRYGIGYERAMRDLHGIDTKNGHIHAGYDFYIALSKEVALLWSLYPFLLLGKWLFIGPAVYRWIATRRRSIFGVCKLPSPKAAPRTFEESDDRWQARWVATVTLHVFLLGFFYVLAIPAPYIGHGGWPTKLANDAHIYGITPINVFNRTDLRMAENWFTLHLLEGATATLAPLLSENGERLSYHRSDRVYFGATLLWRRMTIGSEGCQFEKSRPIIEYLAKVDLHARGKPPGEYHYLLTEYFEPIADSELLQQNLYVRGRTTSPCTLEWIVSNR
jgi:predicted DCC family thiol-disulfide oxidoreductase YuxK